MGRLISPITPGLSGAEETPSKSSSCAQGTIPGTSLTAQNIYYSCLSLNRQQLKAQGSVPENNYKFYYIHFEIDGVCCNLIG